MAPGLTWTNMPARARHALSLLFERAREGGDQLTVNQPALAFYEAIDTIWSAEPEWELKGEKFSPKRRRTIIADCTIQQLQAMGAVSIEVLDAATTVATLTELGGRLWGQGQPG